MITLGISSSNKHFGSISPGVFAPPHMREIYTQNLRIIYFFFPFIWAPNPIDEPVGPIFAFYTLYDVVLCKELPFGGEKI